MKLTQVILSGLFTYRDITVLDLDQNGLMLINGEIDGDGSRSNGAGKSSLIDAICLCLFKTTTKGLTGSNVINRDSESGWAELYFNSGGICYKSRFEASGSRSKLSLWQWDLSDMDTTVPTNEEVDGKWVNISERSGKDTLEVIESITGMDFATFKNSVLFAQDDVSVFISGTDSVRKKLFTQILGLDRLDEALARATLKVREEKLLLFTKEQQQASCKTKLANEAEIRDDRDKCEEEAKGTAEEIKALRTKLALIESHEADILALDESMEKQSEHLQKTNRLEYEWTKDFSEPHHSAMLKLECEINGHIKKLEEIESAEEGVVKLEEERERVEKEKADQSDLQEKKAKLENAFGRSCSIRDEQRSTLESVQNQLDLIQSGDDTTCPLCRSTLSDLHGKKDIIESLSTKKEELETSIELFAKQLDGFNKDIIKCNTELARIGEFLSWPETKNVERRLGELQALVSMKGEFEEKLRAAENSREERSRSFEDLKQQHTVKRLKLDEEKKRLNAEFDEIQKRCESFGVTTPKDRVMKWIEDAEGNRDIINREIGTLDSYLAEIEKIKKELPEIETEISGITGNIKHLEFICEMFGPDGIKSKVIRSVTPRLSMLANEYLTQIADGMSIEFVTSYEGKSKTIDDFRIMVCKGTYTADIRSFSGGERKLLEFAVRFAIADVVRERAEVNVRDLILDEPFDGLDRTGIDRVIALLRGLTEKFPSITAVCHIDYAKEQFDRVVTVAKSGESSRIL